VAIGTVMSRLVRCQNRSIKTIGRANHGAFSNFGSMRIWIPEFPEIAKTSGKLWGEFAWNISWSVAVYRASVLVMKSPSLCRDGTTNDIMAAVLRP
jgi:hypothetical protein